VTKTICWTRQIYLFFRPDVLNKHIHVKLLNIIKYRHRYIRHLACIVILKYGPKEILFLKNVPCPKIYGHQFGKSLVICYKSSSPQLLGRYFSRTSAKPKQLLDQPSNSEPYLCTPSETIITCTSETCSVKLYHQKCIGLKN
jgi:hypothetical protein